MCVCVFLGSSNSNRNNVSDSDDEMLDLKNFTSNSAFHKDDSEDDPLLTGHSTFQCNFFLAYFYGTLF